MNNDVLALAGKFILASTTDDDNELQRISVALAAELTKEKTDGSAPPALNKDFIGFLKFTDKEILKMPKNLRNIFRADGYVIHYRKRKRGKNSCSYEARYSRHGFKLSVSATTLQALKERFIAALNAIDKESPLPNTPATFHEFATYYLETFWRRKVAERTYKTELNRYNNHIAPHFGSMPLKSITPAKCQELFDKLAAEGKGKTLDEVYGRLNQIFDGAIKHSLIKYNPVELTVISHHEREHGKALTKTEERELLAAVNGTPYLLMFAVGLYTGLRPNEYATARIDGEFIVAVNSKRKNGKIEYKKIPITPMLRPYLQGVNELHFFVINRLREKFKTVLPDHTLKDLRETFNTRCIECGVEETARKRFMGHSLGALGNAYTDLSDEYLIQQGNKIKY